MFNDEFNVNTDMFVYRYNYIRSYGEHMYEFVYYSVLGFSHRKIIHINDFGRTFIFGKTKSNNHKEIITYVVSDGEHLTSSEILAKVRDSLTTYLKTTSDINKKDKSSILTIIEELNKHLCDLESKIYGSGVNCWL